MNARPARGGFAFPFGDPHLHTESVPFMRAIGARWIEGCAPAAGYRLPCRPAVCGGDGAIDLRATIALLDHAGGVALFAAGVAEATATLDLRVDVGTALRPGLDLWVEAHAVEVDGGSALVTAEARDEPGGAPRVRLTGRYVMGLAPGRANDVDDPARALQDASARYADALPPAAASFDALLALHDAHDAHAGVRLDLPFEPWLVGAVTLPALHGGSVAAGLVSAAERARPAASHAGGLRMVSLSLQYLRAAGADTTRFTAAVTKSGPRTVYVAASATQQGGRQVATAQALFA